ncbi:MAG: phosphotransferase [Candidatus Acidiferrum sp.]
MKSLNRTDRDTFSLIIVRRNGSEILLSSGESGWSLPSVQILPRQRLAPQLMAELNTQLGIQAYCLFVPSFTAPDRNPPRANHVVLESVTHNDEAPTGTCWTPRTASACQRVCPVEDAEAITESLREMDSYGGESKRGLFGRPGWLRELFAWTQEQLSPLGLRANGKFRQFNAGPTFSLFRLATNRGAAWFKATGEPNLRELPITLCLARLFPGNLPPILGVNTSWNGWLSEEVSNTTLDQCTEFSVWERVAENLAELQIASIGKCSALLDAQTNDLRIPVLNDLIAPFLALMAELMAVQVTQSPPRLTVSELDSLGTRLREALLLLQNLGFPDTLGHIDFNPGNIVVSPARCVFLDWAEACVTHPVVTFEYLREHARRNLTQVTTASARIATAYLRPWTTLLAPDDLAQALTVSPLIAVFIYAVATSGWCSPETLRSRARSAYLRSLARRMYSEAMLRAKGENNGTFNSPISNRPAVFQFPV